MQMEVIERKTGSGQVYEILEYRRYTKKGTGPEKGLRKVGDKVEQIRMLHDIVVITLDQGDGYPSVIRHNLGRAEGEPYMCEIVAITQRRKISFWGGKRGLTFYDSHFKLRSKGGNTHWNSGGKYKHEYPVAKRVTVSSWDEVLEQERKAEQEYASDE